jgi:hypothetical protein
MALKLVSYGQVNYWQRLIKDDRVKRALNGVNDNEMIQTENNVRVNYITCKIIKYE